MDSQTLTEEPILSDEEIQAAYQLLSAPLSAALVNIINAPGTSETAKTFGNTRQILSPKETGPTMYYYERQNSEDGSLYRRFRRSSGHSLPWRKGTEFELLLAEGEKPKIRLDFDESSPSDQRALYLEISPEKSNVFVAGNIRFGQTFVMCWVEYIPMEDPFRSNGNFEWQIDNLKLFPYQGMFGAFGRLMNIEPLTKTDMFGEYPRQRASEFIHNPTFQHDYLQSLILRMVNGELDQDLGAFLPGFTNVEDQDLWLVDYTHEPIADLQFI